MFLPFVSNIYMKTAVWMDEEVDTRVTVFAEVESFIIVSPLNFFKGIPNTCVAQSSLAAQCVCKARDSAAETRLYEFSHS